MMSDSDDGTEAGIFQLGGDFVAPNDVCDWLEESNQLIASFYRIDPRHISNGIDHPNHKTGRFFAGFFVRLPCNKKKESEQVWINDNFDFTEQVEESTDDVIVGPAILVPSCNDHQSFRR